MEKKEPSYYPRREKAKNITEEQKKKATPFQIITSKARAAHLSV
jgi:hypothetical protein